jgi:hypothetical protein
MNQPRPIQAGEIVEYCVTKSENGEVGWFRSRDGSPVWIPDGTKVYLAQDETQYTFHAQPEPDIETAEGHLFLGQLVDGDRLCEAS